MTVFDIGKARATDALLPLAAIVLWGGNSVVAKLSAEVIGPVEVTYYRWLIAALLLAPFALGPIARNPVEFGRQLPRMVALGLLGCALFPYLMYLAAGNTTATNIGIIQTLMPLIAIALSGFLFGTEISRAAVFGASISLLGVVMLVSQGRPGMLLSHPLNRGDLIMLAATACFALYSVLLARWRSALPLTSGLFVQSSVAVIAMLPAFVLAPDHAIKSAAVPLVAYAAILSSIAAPLMWMKGISRIGSARSATFFNVLPLVTAALAIALLGEPLTISLVIGGLLVISGVVLAERGAMAESTRPATI